jgi:hypothetical protein
MRNFAWALIALGAVVLVFSVAGQVGAGALFGGGMIGVGIIVLAILHGPDPRR